MTTEIYQAKRKCGGVADDDEHFPDSNIMLSFVAFMIISDILYICIIYDMGQGC